ncbi:MAG: hypothetical protein GY803_10690 [Chloroflexi bacterium]|nr:hypothetical protein [Chloroflexota bacterium]
MFRRRFTDNGLRITAVPVGLSEASNLLTPERQRRPFSLHWGNGRLLF